MFSKQELTGIEARLSAEPLTPEDVITVMNLIKDKYLEQAQPIWRDGLSDLWDYTLKVNSHLGRHIFCPGGIVGTDRVSSTHTDIENLKVNLKELLLLREDGKSNTDHKDEATVERYTELLKTKYAHFFEQIVATAEQSPNIRISPNFDHIPGFSEASHADFTYFLMPRFIVIKVREAVFNEQIRVNTSYQTF